MPYINEDNNNVPSNSIVFYPSNLEQSKEENWNFNDIIESLVGKQKREYFKEHAYLCLPLTIANQYGFVVKANTDLMLYWPGGESEVIVETGNGQNTNDDGYIQSYFTNFRSGILSIENGFILRTEPGVNLMTIQPPNFFIPGLHVMSGVVETDNLRRSFTFNIKVTTPKTKIYIKKGQWLSGFIPIKRYFVDNFSLVDFFEVFDDNTYNLERASIEKLHYERNGGDEKKHREAGLYLDNPNLLGAGRRYFKGLFPNDDPFPDHQKRVVSNENNDIMDRE